MRRSSAGEPKLSGGLSVSSSPPDNDSGLGSDSVLPEELKSLNWGACLLNLVWGGAMKVPAGTLFGWFILIAIIPVFPFYLLFKGNEIAWRNRRWASYDEFREVQRKWSTAGWILMAAAVLLVIIFSVWIYRLIRPIINGTGFDPLGLGGL